MTLCDFTTGLSSVSANGESFGNSTVNTTINSSSISVGLIGSTTVGAFISNNFIIIGNNSVNTTANSTHFFSGNSTVYGFSNSTAEGFVNSTSNNISTPGYTTISNSTLYTNTGIGIETFGNSTSNNISNSSSILFNTNASINATVNSTTYSFNYPGVSVVRPYISVLQTVNPLTVNSVSAQAVFPANQQTVTLAATTTYLVDALYITTNTSGTTPASSPAIQTSFANSANIGTMNYEATVYVTNSTGNIVAGQLVTTASATQVGNTFGAGASVTIGIKGIIATANTSTTITPKVTFTQISNSTPQVGIGSYILFTPVCNTTAGTSNLYGSWS